MKIVQNKKIYFTISIIIILAGIISFCIQGFNLGLDFKGGTIMTVAIGEEYNTDDIKAIFTEKGYATPEIQKSDENTAIIRFIPPANQDISTVRDTLNNALKAKYPNSESPTSESISATASKELVASAFWTVFFAAICMLIYVWVRFEVNAGIAAVIGIVHDLAMMMTAVTILQIPLNSTFIAVVLTIVGYVMYDTIVIFDRIRENNKAYNPKEYSREFVAEKSIWQSLPRTINTSATYFITITILYVIGVQSMKDFTLPIIAGIIGSFYSSVFINPSVWSIFAARQIKKAK